MTMRRLAVATTGTLLSLVTVATHALLFASPPPPSPRFGLGPTTTTTRHVARHHHTLLNRRRKEENKADRVLISTKAVWSDSRATLDYQNLLDGKIPERLPDGPATVIGDDALGVALAKMAPAEPDPVISLDALASIPSIVASRPGPIYVSCAAPAKLPDIILACPDERREDLVFVNYGDMIEPTLKRYGLCRDYNTQAVAYYAVNEYQKVEDDRSMLGEDAMGQAKFAAETSVTGKWAGAYSDRLRRNGLFCNEVFYRDFRRHMLERVIFETVYNLVAVLHQRVPVSEVPRYFANEADDMIYELMGALRGNLAVALLSGAEERLAKYAEVQFRSKQDNKLPICSATSPFRNKFFYDEISQMMKQRDFPDPAPMHTEYWEYAIANGLLDP